MALTLYHQDTFDRSNSALEASEFSDALGAWATVEGTWSVSSNKAVCTAGSDAGIFDSNMADAADQAAEVVVTGVGLGIILRHNGNTTGAAATYYLAYVTGGSEITIYRRNAGSFTSLTTVGGVADGDTLKFSAVGTTLTAYINGVSQGSTTDATYASGKAGLYSGTGTTMDNFKSYVEQSATARPKLNASLVANSPLLGGLVK